MKFWRKLEDILTPFEAALFLALGYVILDIPLAIAFNHTPTPIELGLDMLLSALMTWHRSKYPIKRPIAQFTKLQNAGDWLSCVPWLSLLAAIGYENTHWITYLQLVRLPMLPQLVKIIYDRSQDKLVPRRLKFMIAIYCTSLLLNTFACGWLIIYPSTEDSITAYNKAIYWLITTIATVGYGDITPHDNIGRVYAMFMMIMGATIWGILIASASRMMLASDRRKEKKKEKMEALQSFFNHYDIPKNLQQQVVGFYNHILSQKISEDEHAVMSELPSALQSELQIYMNLKPIERVSLFQGCSIQCLSAAAKKLEQVFYSPGDPIVRKGEVGLEMFLIGHGQVTVHDGETFITSLGDGQCFGELALIGEGIRGADITALSYCDVFKLSKERFDELFKNHAELRTNIERIVSDRRAKVASRARASGAPSAPSKKAS